MSRLDAIKARLEAAMGYHRAGTSNSAHITEEMKDVFAHAPADLRLLLRVVEAAEAHVKAGCLGDRDLVLFLAALDEPEG